MQLLLLLVIGSLIGLVLSVRHKVVALVAFTSGTAGLIVLSNAISPAEINLLQIAIAILVVGAAMQAGYVAGLFIQAMAVAARQAKADSKPAMTRH